ncbi:MAG: type II toxin-antitoxin system RelE/ParE family toxin [Eubacteriales bacterium]|nr:type II toxin-antitoxin system RelE/ParE family toxin [Eubacteriales bacterium]
MIFEIEFSEQAENDLRSIYEYIAFELQSPENAAGQFGRLETEIMKLNHMPERFREYEYEPWHSRGLRLMPVQTYWRKRRKQKKQKRLKNLYQILLES